MHESSDNLKEVVTEQLQDNSSQLEFEIGATMSVFGNENR